MSSEEGTPQGGPLGPVLVDILLDILDRELERHGHQFVRYAQDCNICVRSKQVGEQVIKNMKTFLQEKSKLKVNKAKSPVDRPCKRKFLGSSMYLRQGGLSTRLVPETIKRVKNKIPEMTSRSKPESVSDRIRTLDSYLSGWVSCYTLAETPSKCQELEG